MDPSENWNDLPDPVRSLLQRRGLTREFISSDYNFCSSWKALPGAETAVSLIGDAVAAGEKIMIHGDFDADGITAAATAVRVLRYLGADVIHHIPCRFTEGYGLGETGVSKCIAEKVKLLVTVDCGITAVDEVRILKEAGIKVIITDHHVPEDTLPDAHAIVDPELADNHEQPWRYLSGAGVIHTVLRGLFTAELPREMMPDLVAIGTVCDMVNLTGDNRNLVKWGLKVMQTDPCPGIEALLRKAEIQKESLSAFDLGFGIGPRINSAGRITHADKALALLLAADPREAEELASELDRSNTRRKSLDSMVFEEALPELSRSTASVCVAASSRWHPGVIGISASKIAGSMNRPAILISWDDDRGRGSARGVPGMPVHGLLSMAMEAGLLERFGGHSMAAGITILREKYQEFKSFVEEQARKMFSEPELPVLYIDGGLQPDQCSASTLSAVNLLGPFGQGNPEPVWISRGLFAASYRTVGREGKHLQINFQQGAHVLRTIGFNMGDRTSELNRPLDIAFKLKPDRWRGGDNVQLVLEDIKPAAPRAK